MLFNLPFPFYFNHYNYRYRYPQNYNYNYYKKTFPENTSQNASKKEDIIENTIEDKQKASEYIDSSEAFFELFGLKLYFDDVLIICILFFLYTEKVKNDELFICLILLLLT